MTEAEWTARCERAVDLALFHFVAERHWLEVALSMLLLSGDP